jgi:hypothetical protein
MAVECLALETIVQGNYPERDSIQHCLTSQCPVSFYNRFNGLKCAIKIHTRYQYTAVQNQDIISFVTKELIARGLLSTCARVKPLAPVAVAKDIIRFLFVSDKYKHLHPHIRSQMAFAIQSMLLVDVGPGKVVESDA